MTLLVTHFRLVQAFSWWQSHLPLRALFSRSSSSPEAQGVVTPDLYVLVPFGMRTRHYLAKRGPSLAFPLRGKCKCGLVLLAPRFFKDVKIVGALKALKALEALYFSRFFILSCFIKYRNCIRIKTFYLSFILFCSSQQVTDGRLIFKPSELNKSNKFLKERPLSINVAFSRVIFYYKLFRKALYDI